MIKFAADDDKNKEEGIEEIKYENKETKENSIKTEREDLLIISNNLKPIIEKNRRHKVVNYINFFNIKT